jgi:vacuolar-type H+-ATPase subunit I/STV1
MKKVSILLYQSYLEDVIKKLHEQGLVQIINIEKDDQTVHDLLQKTEAPPEASTFSTYELRLTKLIDILAKTKKTPKGITAILHPELPAPKEIQSRSAQELTVDVEHVFDTLEKKILDYDNQLRQLDEYHIRNKELETQLSLIKDFCATR